MTPTHLYKPPARMAGFTLLELMITVTVAAILLGIGVPAFSDIIRNNRLTAGSNDLLHSTQRARSEAVKRQTTVAVCATANAEEEQPSCSNGAFSQWVVFVDSDGDWMIDDEEEVLERHGALPASVTVRNDNGGIVSYAANGFPTPPPAGGVSPTRNVVICDSRGNQQIGTNSTARAMLIEGTGRTRVSRNFDEVTAAIGQTGDCPR
ncbi:GspH/FimT family pseudopilin [Steroidobacter sp. S1-65]|uniref:Type II secretion system protein H n=1 Tax=Steroidobacter gossypii TaxID=2805490 RepID=A0ABS1WW26_9GAMM|nr:GspH/FimT family pseudopilin [Steroidobacter gossypii]MBM0105164.1 GspH/FimT family pseudopilin [Steroidobacter gossypii]